MYRITASNNGDDGTPNAGCSGGFCFGQDLQFAVWQHALIITTNEFGFFYEYRGANVYAVDKAALVQGKDTAKTALVRTDTGKADDPRALKYLQPARQTGSCDTPNTYLMATLGAMKHGEHVVQLFTLRGTETLATRTAWVSFEWVEPTVKLGISYRVPPDAVQKAGDIPAGYWFYPEESKNGTKVPWLDTEDARMRSVSFVDDLLYCTWATAVKGRTKLVSGVAYAVVDPKSPAKAVDSGFLHPQGDLYVLDPFLAVGPGGVGVLAVSVSGSDTYPSPAYAGFSGEGFGPLKIIVEGAGPLDTWGAYENDLVNPFGGYSAAVVGAHGTFWVASEYVAQNCSVQAYGPNTGVNGPTDNTCGGIRARGANWATRITKLALPRY